MVSAFTRLQAQKDANIRDTATLLAGSKPDILVFSLPCALDLLYLISPVEFIYIKHLCSLTPPPPVLIIHFPSFLRSFP
jgi:hypothetical protein